MGDMTNERALPRRRAWIPGEEGIWAVVFGDLIVFAIMFGSFAWHRAASPAVFAADRLLLDRTIALTNTLVLLTSSALVAWAVQTRRRDPDRRKGVRAVFAAAGLGLVFAALKIFEWSGKFAQGITADQDDFFVHYFMLGGIHLLHVLVGSGFLVIAGIGAHKGTGSVRTLESAGVFWHLVDLLWVFLFALFYLAG